MTPSSRQPHKAIIHSGRFSPYRMSLSSFADTRFAQPAGKSPRFCGYFVIAIVMAAKAVIVDEKFVGQVREVVEEIEQVVAGHPLHCYAESERSIRAPAGI